METIRIKLADLVQNKGQIPGLPGNPRQWTKEDVDRIAKSLRETPELFDLRPCLVFPYGGQNIILGGNLRYEGARRNKDKDVPCAVIPADTPVEKLKEIVIKDNGSFGSWDADALANEWDDLPLGDWGVPDWVTGEAGDEEDKSGGKPDVPKDDKVEAMLREAMRENVTEALAQINHMMLKGWIAQFLTLGAVKAQFLRAKYYGKPYPQYLSLYFCPQRFMTSANEISIYEQMRKCAEGAEAGIAGFRTISEDGPLNVIQKAGYPIGGARMPLDFPALKARELIEEFGGAGCSVLDPCHGWGGRLAGALMADVALYCGVDPSPDANAGVWKAADAFLPYCPGSRVELINAPFEDVDLSKRVFDMAITSPPYFDVEQYNGEGQSHIRYGDYDKWVECFFRVLIRKTHAALKAGGVFVLQVGSKTYPLLKDGTRIAEAVGFKVEDVRPFGGGTSSALHGNDDNDLDNEKIIILRKGATL